MQCHAEALAASMAFDEAMLAHPLGADLGGAGEGFHAVHGSGLLLPQAYCDYNLRTCYPFPAGGSLLGVPDLPHAGDVLQGPPTGMRRDASLIFPTLFGGSPPSAAAQRQQQACPFSCAGMRGEHACSHDLTPRLFP